MARVSHKKVRQLLDEKRSKITDRQFFTSRILAGHFEDIAAAQTRRYKYNRRVHVYLYWDHNDPNVACTDNTVIKINCGNKVVTKIRGRLNRYKIISGLFAHELGHVLYTDFLAKQTYLRYLEHEKWFPGPPNLKTTQDARNELDFWSYSKAEPRNLQMIQYIASFIANVLEDGYVEARVLNQFTGVLGCSLEEMRQAQYEDMPTVEELIEKEDNGECHIFNSILQIMLSYAKYGQIKYGSTPLSDERIQAIFNMIPELDTAVTTTYAKERWQVVSFIMVRCWPYIQEYLDICKEKQDEAAAAGDSTSAGDVLAGFLAGIKGSSEAGEGDGTPVAGSEKGGRIANNSKARNETRLWPAQKTRMKKMSLGKKLKNQVKTLILPRPILNPRQDRMRIPRPAISSKPRNRKADAFRFIRRSLYLSLSAVNSSMMPTTSVISMTRQLRILTGCWNGWQRRQPTNSLRMSGSRN